MESGRICSHAVQEVAYKRWVTKWFCCLYFMFPSLWKNAARQTTLHLSQGWRTSASECYFSELQVKSSEALCSTESPSWHCTIQDKAAPCTEASHCAALHWAPAAASGLSLQQSSYWGSNHSPSVLSGKQRITVMIIFILWDISSWRFTVIPEPAPSYQTNSATCSALQLPVQSCTPISSQVRCGMKCSYDQKSPAQPLSWRAAVRVSAADACTPHTLLLGTSGNTWKLFVHIEFTEVGYLDAHWHNSSPAEVGEWSN